LIIVTLELCKVSPHPKGRGEGEQRNDEGGRERTRKTSGEVVRNEEYEAIIGKAMNRCEM
jgi:hypothetical protein